MTGLLGNNTAVNCNGSVTLLPWAGLREHKRSMTLAGLLGNNMAVNCNGSVTALPWAGLSWGLGTVPRHH